MPALTIKGLPPALHRRLKANAEAHHRSLNSEILVCLERAVGAVPFDAGAWLADVADLQHRLPARSLTRAQTQAAKTAGRA